MSEVNRLHSEAMGLADEAQFARRAGEDAKFRSTSREAMDLEARAARMVSPGEEPTRSVLFRSAATLAIDASESSMAEELANEGLAGDPPAEVELELRQVLEKAQVSKLVKDYVGLVTNQIGEDGIRPNQGMAIRRKDDGLDVFALACSPEDWAFHFWNQVGLQGPDDVKSEIVFGLDMVTQPDQGTEFADAYVFVHWKRIPGKKLGSRDCFRVGVLNYQHEPRIVREVDWDNEHWTGWMFGWLSKHRPALLMNFSFKGEPNQEPAVDGNGRGK